MGRGSNLLRLGDFNQTVVLDAIRRAPSGVSRVELGASTGLTNQTVSNIVRRLLDSGLVLETDRIQGQRGKPRTMLRVEPSSAYAVGVHIDAARLTTVLVDMAGAVQGHRHRTTPRAQRPAEVIRVIASEVSTMISSAGLEGSGVLGVGVAAPGPIDIEAGVLSDPPQLKGWRRVPLRSALAESTGLHVLLDKDVTAAATGALWASPERHSNFVFGYLGSGLAAGLVMNGEVLRGSTNNIGDIGMIRVSRSQTDIGVAPAGTLADAVMPKGFVRRAQLKGLLSDGIDLTDYAATDKAYTEFCQLARDGNRHARTIIRKAGDALAEGLGVLVNLLDVDQVVLGGPSWSRISDLMMEDLPERLAATLVVPSSSVQITSSPAGDDVAAQGAAALVLDHFYSPRPSVLLME